VRKKNSPEKGEKGARDHSDYMGRSKILEEKGVEGGHLGLKRKGDCILRLGITVL